MFMDLLKIVLPILGIYLVLILVWWLICSSAAKKAISREKRAYFDFVEMLDLLQMKFWRFISYCCLMGIILWLLLIGKWYFVFLPILWFTKVWWFGSLFYLPFNLVESRYGGRVSVFFGIKHENERRNDPKNLLNKK